MGSNGSYIVMSPQCYVIPWPWITARTSSSSTPCWLTTAPLELRLSSGWSVGCSSSNWGWSEFQVESKCSSKSFHCRVKTEEEDGRSLSLQALMHPDQTPLPHSCTLFLETQTQCLTYQIDKAIQAILVPTHIDALHQRKMKIPFQFGIQEWRDESTTCGVIP